MIQAFWRRAMAYREFGAYFLASLLALAIDFAVLLLLARVVHYLVAATAGFCTGAAVIYLLSTRLVFARRRLAHREGAEFVLFTLIGVAGLVLNNTVIFIMVEFVAAPLALAKLAAAGSTFLFNYLLRKRLLF
ncbi:MAG: GtrA family protein [Rhodocyclales bacterium]|nr:GtrA family protein [Rhodocyclales bacterium]